MRGAIYIAVFLIASVRAFACGIISTPHELDAHEQLMDRAAPERPEVSLASIVRGRGVVRHDDGTVSGTSCDDIGAVSLQLKFIPNDDRTRAEKLGYRIIHVEGAAPENLLVSPKPTRDLTKNNTLFLRWVDGANDEQEPIEFAVAVIAVDLAGNESIASDRVWVRYPGRKP